MIRTKKGTILVNEIDKNRTVLIEDWLTIDEAFIKILKILVDNDQDMDLFEPVNNTDLGFYSYRFTLYDNEMESELIILKWGGYDYHHYAHEFGKVISHCAYELLRKIYTGNDPNREQECARRLRELEKIIAVYESVAPEDLKEAEDFLSPVKNSKELELIFHEICDLLEFTENTEDILKDFLELSKKFVNELNKILSTHIEVQWGVPESLSQEPHLVAKVLLGVTFHEIRDRDVMSDGFFVMREMWRMFASKIEIPAKVTKDSALSVIDDEFQLIVDRWEDFRRLRTTQPRP